jgi:hypothetical protein
MGLVSERPGITDRELANVILGKGAHPSRINQTCRHLESSGLLVRQARADGRIGNYPTGVPLPEVKAPHPSSIGEQTDALGEDQVKLLLKQWLEADGWQTEIAWGRKTGIDIVARRGGEVWIIEAKGCGSLQPMRVNYFIAILGELLQRMSTADAKYSIALPDMQQFRGLWDRLPELARRRTDITALFVSADGRVEHLVE